MLTMLEVNGTLEQSGRDELWLVLRRLKGVDQGELELDLRWFKVLDIQPRG